MSGENKTNWVIPALLIGVLAIGVVAVLAVLMGRSSDSDDLEEVTSATQPARAEDGRVTEEELIVEFGGNEADEPHIWTADDRASFALDTANDINDRVRSSVHDNAMFVDFAWGDGSMIRTSPDGIEWTDISTNGLEGHDDWRYLAVSDGTAVTMTVDWDSSMAFYAASTDLTNWTTYELDVPTDARLDMYPIDIAVDGDRVAVVLGVEPPSADLVFSGTIGEELTLTQLPDDGFAASIETVSGTFAIGIQTPGEELPETVVWTSTNATQWQPAAPLPDNLTGSLHAVGDSMVVVGLGQSDVEVFTAVSTDGGGSWVRGEVDPTIWDTVAGPGGLIGRVEGGWISSRDGIRWTPMPVLIAGGSGDPNVFVEVSAVAVGENEVILTRFESDADDNFSSQDFALPLPG